MYVILRMCQLKSLMFFFGHLMPLRFLVFSYKSCLGLRIAKCYLLSVPHISDFGYHIEFYSCCISLGDSMGVLGCILLRLLLLRRPNHYHQLTFPAAAAVKNCSRVDPILKLRIFYNTLLYYNGFARMFFFPICIYAIKCSASDGCIFQ